jgi:hypothetical protein
MTQVAIVTPETLSAQVEKSEIVSIASTMVVASAVHVEAAKDSIRQIKERRSKIDATFDTHIKAAHAAHKALVATKKGFTDELDEAERIIKGKIGGYELEQRRIQAAAEQKAREEAEAERKKILDAAQKKMDRIIAASGKIEDQIAAVEAELQNGDNTEAQKEFLSRQLEILRLKLDGQQEKALQAQQQAERAAESVPVVAATVHEKTKGVRVVLIPEVTDKMALIQEVAAGRAPESVLDVNMGALKRLCNMGVKIGAGVVCREDTSVSVR